MLTDAKKNYASNVEVQEGHTIPKSERLDVKGIKILTKSDTAESTRKALQKILWEDVMNSPTIDQFKLVKDLAIFERRIINSIQSGSKEYYKPAVVKSINNYDNPMSIQGIKASEVWNQLKTDDLPVLNLDERNAISIAKIILTNNSAEKLKEWPDVYNHAIELLKNPLFKGRVESIAIPLDIEVPNWILEIIDYNTLVNDNMSGFPYSSAAIVKLHSNTNYSNILQL